MLHEKGVLGVEIQEPQLYFDLLNKNNPYDWDYIDDSMKELAKVSPNLTFYLEDTPEGIELLDEILGELCTFSVEKVEVSGVSDEDWNNKWKEFFKPTRITERIVIKPSWEDHEKKQDELVIEIDPGLAFGTGTHPTTVMCVKLLEKYIEKGRSTVFDVGCGSGVLIIASALLGARKVFGVDIDPLAVSVAEENILRNRLDGDIRLFVGDLAKGIETRADIVVANLSADLVVMLSKDIRKNLKENGVFIVSGIINEKKDEVRDALIKSQFKILDILEDDEWCAMAATL
jgi:ribosomal protein L11 methyltransferase